MQTCPFCKFDAGDRPLNEGRCPQCGSIVQWSDEDIAATLSSFPAGAAEQTSGTTNEGQVGGQTETEPMSAGENDRPSADAASAEENHSSPTPTPALLSRLWKDSLSSTGSVRSTLKGEESEVTVSDTVFSIQAREVRAASDDPSESLDYELLGVIGQGGVGVVYSARQASIDRNVALKMLREEYRNRDDHRDKFLAEAVLTGELDHPNIVPIYDLGRSNTGELFYSMKNVVGTPWDRVIGTKSVEENLDILLKVADAVAFAHSRGVIHRDLKPENVMLGNFGEVLVMDWGIALPTAEFRKSASILRSQAMGGTPAYMAPEMAKGPLDTIGPPSDVYLLGAILFETLTGHPPHFGKDVMDCVRNAAKNIIRATNVTGELMDIAVKAMATLPRRRYRQVQEFQAAVRLYQAHSESISLSDNAELDLAEGIKSQDYQKHSQAVFAFQESLVMWPENTLAQSGLSRAKLAYASLALEKGDYDLGLSLLKQDQPDERRLIDQLQAAIRERDARQGRLRTLRRAAVGMVAFILVAGFVALTIIWQLYQDSEKSQREALADRATAIKAQETAQGERNNADAQRREAERQQHEADAARGRTELARLASLADRRRAEENAYIAETGLVAASITQNNFAIAQALLQEQLQSHSKSKLRHWEWGRFQYLVQGGIDDHTEAVDTHKVEETVETVDCLPDVSLIAIGLGNGQCQIWRARDQRITQWNSGRAIYDLDLDASGKLLVTCGLDDNRGICIRVWQLDDVRPPQILKERTLDRQPTCVAFCNAAGSNQLVIGDAKNVARLWDWQSNNPDTFLLGHNGAINQVEYSPDDQWVGTASSDGTVRLFEVVSGKEVQRFSGHKSGVWCLAFSPDNQTVASAGDEGHVLVWPIDATATTAQQIERTRLEIAGKPTTETRYVRLQAHTGTIRDVSFALDGKRLVSAGTDNLVCVWNLSQALAAADAGSTSITAVLSKQPTNADTQVVDVPVLKLRGHGGWVHSCVLSGDGTQVLSGADDHTWKVWRADQYRESLSMGDGTSALGDAQFSPDGKTIVLAIADGTIQLWDRATGKIVSSLTQGHEYLTNRAQFIDNGEKLVTAAGDNTLRIWDVVHGSQLQVMEHSGRSVIFGVSPDARWLITTGDEKGVAVLDLASADPPMRFRKATTLTGRKVGTASKTFTEPACVAISDDGHYFVVGDNTGRCEFWDRTTGEKMYSVLGHAESIIAALALPSAQNQSIFITAAADGTVAWWNALDGKELAGERLAHRSPIQLAAVSPDRRFLVTSSMLGNSKGRLWLWDINTRQSIATYDTADKSIQDIAFRKYASFADTELIVTTSDLKNSDKELWSWQPARKLYESINRRGWLSASTWGTATGSDPNTILIYGGRGARLWSWQQARPLMQYRSSASATAVALSPDGKWLAGANEDGSIILWDLALRSPHETFANVHEARINDLAFSPDSQHLASVGADALIYLRKLKTGDVLVKRLDDKSLSLSAITFSPDGLQIAITADDELVRVHDTATLDQKHVLPGHVGRVLCAQFSPDQLWLATGGEDKIIRIWSLSDQRVVRQLVGHSADITSLDFSADGVRLLSGSRDTTAKIWDVSQSVPTGQELDKASNAAELRELFTLEEHASDVLLAQFSPDGSEILTASKEGKAIIWPACKIPIALRLSKPSIDYPVGSGRIAMDSHAIISQPHMSDLRNARLRIRRLLEDAQAAITELPEDFIDSITLDTSDGLFELQGEQVMLKASQQTVAQLSRPSEIELEIQFDTEVAHPVAQQLIRHLQYEASSSYPDAAAKHKRTYQFELCNQLGDSGNAAAEELIVNLMDPSSPSMATKVNSSGQSAAANHLQSIRH